MPAPSAEPRPAHDYISRTESAVEKLRTQLRDKLQSAMKDGGPARAFEVCARDAQAMYASIRNETGVTVGRASLPLRNPADPPPPWVRNWLEAQAERKPAEAKPLTTISVNGASRVVRVLRPIFIEAPCLPCHGQPNELDDAVKKLLAERYPKDAPTGYRIGDLRGAYWAETPIGG